MKRISIAILVAALWSGTPLAQAAGLGRLTVLSPLGQPLNAEIEVVSLQPGEEESLTARLASMEAFRQAGVEYSEALSTIRFNLERRNGRSVVRVTTTQPVNEPFVDFLVELQWNTGRLVREYTVLLDPPEYRRPPSVAAAPAPSVVPPEAAPLPPEEKRAPAEAQTAPQATEQQAPVAPAIQTTQPVASAATTHEVKPGETLGQIARRHLPPGVTLNQMMIALYRANPKAFIRENINLVRAGRILNIPAGDAVGTVDREEANRLVQAHRAEWEEYRTRLAAAPSTAETAMAERAVEGTIDAKPQPKAPGTPEDQVRLAKVDPQSGAAGSAAAQEDDAVARDRALKEAQSRVAELEKNLADLQKLLELRNQQLAALEKAASGQPTAPAAAASTAQAPTNEAKAAATEAPSADKPQAVAPAPAPKKAEPAANAKKATPAPPPPAPSLVDELLGDPVTVAGLGGVVALLLGYGAIAWRRKKAAQAKLQEEGALAMAPEPAFVEHRAEGAPVPGGASQPVGPSEPDEVDPVQEANVYLAYGRDAQAEEILKEAVQKDPQRLAAHAKLLEIYAQRKDPRSFEQTALKVKSITNGAGPEWEKAAALGRGIDASNPLYAAAAGAVAAVVPAAAAAEAPALDFDLGASDATSPDITLDDKADRTASIDFDLGALSEGGEDKAKSDFTPEGTLIMGKQEPESTFGGLDFDLNLGAESKPAAADAKVDPVETSGGLDFDLDLDLGAAASEGPGKQGAAPALDLSHISLDLGVPTEASSNGAANDDPKWQEVATKLDLAKAYEEMGDKDGARELLSEVIKDGDAAQKGEAELLLAKLS